MTAAVPLAVSKVIAWKKMTEIVVIFLKEVTFISEFLLKNSNATENYSVITNRNGKSRPRPQNKFLVPFQQAPPTFS